MKVVEEAVGQLVAAALEAATDKVFDPDIIDKIDAAIGCGDLQLVAVAVTAAEGVGPSYKSRLAGPLQALLQVRTSLY